MSATNTVSVKTGRYEHELRGEAKLTEWVKDKPAYMREFLSCLQGVEYTTRKQYIEHVWRYLTWLQGQGIDVQDLKGIEKKSRLYANDYLGYLKTGVAGRQKEISASYRSIAWTALKHFYDFLVEIYGFEKNPMVDITRPNAAKDKVNKDALTMEEVSQIIYNIKHGIGRTAHNEEYYEMYMKRDLLMFILLIDTGARITGLLELNLEDFDCENCKVTITSKGHVTKDYYLTQETIKCYQDWLIERSVLLDNPENHAVFINQAGSRWSYKGVNQMLKVYSGNISKHVIPHTTRTTIATLLYNETGDIELVKDKLGHSSTATTSRYIKKDDEHIKRANAIGAAVISQALN